VCGPTTGLWRLVVAATAQGSEREVYQAAAPPLSAARGRGRGWIGEGAQRRVHFIADALRDNVAWNDNWRRVDLARNLLVGDDAPTNEQMLYEQRLSRWSVLLHGLENTPDYDHPLFRGLFRVHNDLEGRSGTAVWRAERKVDQLATVILAALREVVK
jgi:hypothetical protein